MTDLDGWRGFIIGIKVKTPRYMHMGEWREFVEYDVTGCVRGIDFPEIDEVGIWLDNQDVTEHLKESVIDEIEEKLFELAAREEI